MRFSKVLLLTVVVISAGLTQACDPAVQGYVDADDYSHFAPGTTIFANCGGDMVSGLVSTAGAFSIPIGAATGDCTFGEFESPIYYQYMPGLLIGNRLYDCVEGCAFTISGELVQNIGAVSFNFRCNDASCELFCGCPINFECNACRAHCYELRLCGY